VKPVTSKKPHRAGVVAILGRPNAGKSTLLNRLLGQKLAIVTRKPQTTRSRILGILTLENAQLLLLDTPGFHDSPKALNRYLNETVEEALEDCDAAVLLVDAVDGWDESHEALCARLAKRGAPVVLVATKSDRPGSVPDPWPPPRVDGVVAALRVSARTGEGVEVLVSQMVELVPEAPAYFPADEVTDRSLRFLAAELVREAAFVELAQEIPYSTAVEIEGFDESDADLVRIRANLVVERHSQKGMVIGRGGSMIKRIGIRARQGIEELLETQVHLELWVKVEARWWQRPKRRRSLGYF
jgi:GTP-binding protein Era